MVHVLAVLRSTFHTHTWGSEPVSSEGAEWAESRLNLVRCGSRWVLGEAPDKAAYWSAPRQDREPRDPIESNRTAAIRSRAPSNLKIPVRADAGIQHSGGRLPQRAQSGARSGELISLGLSRSRFSFSFHFLWWALPWFRSWTRSFHFLWWALPWFRSSTRSVSLNRWIWFRV